MCKRNVGTMAQPHIIDHTRLHLDILAEIPIVAAFAVQKEHAAVGVQTGFDCGTQDEVHYEEDVVSVCWGGFGFADATSDLLRTGSWYHVASTRLPLRTVTALDAWFLTVYILLWTGFAGLCQEQGPAAGSLRLSKAGFCITT